MAPRGKAAAKSPFAGIAMPKAAAAPPAGDNGSNNNNGKNDANLVQNVARLVCVLDGRVKNIEAAVYRTFLIPKSEPIFETLKTGMDVWRAHMVKGQPHKMGAPRRSVMTSMMMGIREIWTNMPQDQCDAFNALHGDEYMANLGEICDKLGEASLDNDGLRLTDLFTKHATFKVAKKGDGVLVLHPLSTRVTEGDLDIQGFATADTHNLLQVWLKLLEPWEQKGAAPDGPLVRNISRQLKGK